MSKIQIKRLAANSTIGDINVASTTLDIGQPFYDQINGNLYIGDGCKTIGQLKPVGSSLFFDSINSFDSTSISFKDGIIVSIGNIEADELNVGTVNSITINATTINATTINASINASSGLNATIQTNICIGTNTKNKIQLLNANFNTATINNIIASNATIVDAYVKNLHATNVYAIGSLVFDNISATGATFNGAYIKNSTTTRIGSTNFNTIELETANFTNLNVSYAEISQLNGTSSQFNCGIYYNYTNAYNSNASNEIVTVGRLVHDVGTSDQAPSNSTVGYKGQIYIRNYNNHIYAYLCLEATQNQYIWAQIAEWQA